MQPNGNLMVDGSVPTEWSEYQVQDVSSHLEAWAKGERLFSRLSWADTLRNVRIANWLHHAEPNVVLEIGCGLDHPVGRMIAGMGLDTHYVGLDVVPEHAVRVLLEKGKRAFAGVNHDITQGLPFRDESVDVVLSMEMLAQAVRDEEGLRNIFAEIRDVLKPWGWFFLATPVTEPGTPLQHPHCHTVEHSAQDMLTIAADRGFRLMTCFNYRAKPVVAEQMHDRLDEVIGNQAMLPASVEDAFMLPKQTWGLENLVPGNALFAFTLANADRRSTEGILR